MSSSRPWLRIESRRWLADAARLCIAVTWGAGLASLALSLRLAAPPTTVDPTTCRAFLLWSGDPHGTGPGDPLDGAYLMCDLKRLSEGDESVSQPPPITGLSDALHLLHQGEPTCRCALRAVLPH